MLIKLRSKETESSAPHGAKSFKEHYIKQIDDEDLREQVELGIWRRSDKYGGTRW